ncbi:MAG: hypothetical protein QM734_07085 [Cyclobacteriaceae bacterium]
MVLHCGCRLGLVDFVYQQRHDIALVLGLIKEKPIAVCGSDYSADSSLKIETQDNTHSVPKHIVEVRDINLFFISSFKLQEPEFKIQTDKNLVPSSDQYKFTLHKSVFHPPSVLS